MKICGVTAEYNPFHKGHAYHIAKAKELSGADALIVVMSGHFVQRGEPAITDPYKRAEAALRSGADAVFMMPPEASTSSAEGFAEYAVRLMSQLGCDCISCGIEPGQPVEKLLETGALLANETEELSLKIKSSMKTGISYPEALARAAGIETLGPNSLLAVEYVKALRRTGSSMEFVPVRREGSAYSDEMLRDGEFPSATALRKAILHGEKTDDGPMDMSDPDSRCLCLGPDDFLPEIINSIQRSDDLCEYLDVDGAIASRLNRSGFYYHTFEEMVKDIKTKEYTYTRIARALIHILLEIREAPGKPELAQLIGFAGQEVMSELKKRSETEISGKAADHHDQLESSAKAAAIYNQVFWKKYQIELPNFYRQNIIKI